MKDIMIDIETLDIKPGAVILSIAAVPFHRKTGDVADSFFEIIEIQSCLDAGLTINGDTLEWWLQQPEKARKYSFGESGMIKYSLFNVLHKLHDFIKFHEDADNDGDVRVWGNGSIFDISIIESAYRTVNPHLDFAMWNFRKVRDVRTVVDLGEELGYSLNEFDIEHPFEGIKHNPIDDAKHQVKMVCWFLNKMKGNI